MLKLKKDISKLENITYKKIMYRLINIYEQECSFNDGCLGFSDLLVIFNLFYFLENGEILYLEEDE